jgi:hypothetical protein
MKEILKILNHHRRSEKEVMTMIMTKCMIWTKNPARQRRRYQIAIMNHKERQRADETNQRK